MYVTCFSLYISNPQACQCTNLTEEDTVESKSIEAEIILKNVCMETYIEVIVYCRESLHSNFSVILCIYLV